MFGIEPVSLTEPGSPVASCTLGLATGVKRAVGGRQRHFHDRQPRVRIGHPQVPVEDQVVVLGHCNGALRRTFTGGSLTPLTMMPTVTVGRGLAVVAVIFSVGEPS